MNVLRETSVRRWTIKVRGTIAAVPLFCLLAWQSQRSTPILPPGPTFPSPLESNSLAPFPSPQIQTDIPSVCETLADYFPVGAAIWQGDVTGPHSELLKKHFNSITAENDMKWSSLRPSEAAFNFAKADILVAFARANRIRVRGHTLVWHKQNPAWLFKDAAGKDLQPSSETKALLLQRLEKHIRRVVGHFKEDVYAWDVSTKSLTPTSPTVFAAVRGFCSPAPTTLTPRFASHAKLRPTPNCL